MSDDAIRVRPLRRGDHPGKVAAWQAFLGALGLSIRSPCQIQDNPPLYDGAYDHALMCAIEAYLRVEKIDTEHGKNTDPC